MPPSHLLFTDIDGTIVHYPDTEPPPPAGPLATPNSDGEWADSPAGRVLRLPPSSTGKRGAISETTLRLLADAHARGDVAVAIVSGARGTTLAARLPCLPPAAALAAENAAGPLSNDALPPLHRSGPLWDAYRAFISDGWTPDAAGYTTAFRVPVKGGKTETDLAAALARLPPTLASSRNLGCADVYPATSGKAAVGAYVAHKLGLALKSAAFLCDDDNDLRLAAAVGRAFVVSTTHDAVTAAVQRDPGHYWTTEEAGTMAADAAVAAALAWLGVDTASQEKAVAAAAPVPALV